MTVQAGLRTDFRRVTRMVLRWALVAGVILGLFAAAVVSFPYLTGARDKTPTLSDLPLGSFGYAAVQVLDCIEAGAQECPEYERSQGFLAGTPEGIIYQPRNEQDPGARQGDGTAKMTLLHPKNPAKTTPEKEWEAFAAATTLDGAVNPRTVTEADFATVSPGPDVTVSFPVIGPDGMRRTGTMAFRVDGATIALRSVTYTPAYQVATSGGTS